MEIIIRSWADCEQLHLQEEDRGVNFNLQSTLPCGLSNGLSGMIERSAACRCAIDIDSEIGQGSNISANYRIIVETKNGVEALEISFLLNPDMLVLDL